MKNTLLTLIVSFGLYGAMLAQSNPMHSTHWPDFNSNNYEWSDEFVACVSIDNVMILPTDNYIDYEVGFFVDGECRGHDFLYYYDGDNYPVTNLSLIYHDLVTSDLNREVSFKLYDHVNSFEYTYCTSSRQVVTGTPDTDWDDPVILRFMHTYDLPITHYTNTTTSSGWYLIASPLNAAETDPTTVTNMISNDYDFYFFDQTGAGNGKEWKNWKEDVNGGSTNHGFNLVPGTGYLYANSQDVTLTFIGAPYNGTNVVELSRAATVAHEKMRGWNLIGNSFTTAKTIGGRGYYRMNPVGRSELIAGTGNIDAMEGIFVYYDPEDDNAANREETVTFTNPSLKRAEGDDMVLLTLNRNNDGTIDRVIVRFDEGGTLPKYTLRDNSTIIYIPQADKDYAVVKGSATNVFPVNFKTEDFGTYTLSADISGANVDYMHLIDKITGEDVDMLLEGEYSFVAAPVDREDRFILRLNYSGYFDNESDIFAYQNGSDIVVCGEGTLQVFDVMGRYVTSYEVNGVQSIQAMPMGVYIFRMLGDDVKTQKIYVR